MDIAKPFSFASPHAQPAAGSPRLAFMAWEQQWAKATWKKDVGMLALLAGQQIDTPEKSAQASLSINTLASNHARYCRKSLRLLLKAGARVDPACVPALCMHGPASVVLLQNHGVDLTGRNGLEETALHLACDQASDHGFSKSWLLLLEAGLDPYAKDKDGQSALARAGERGRTELAQRAINEANLENKDLSGPKGRRVKTMKKRA